MPPSCYSHYNPDHDAYQLNIRHLSDSAAIAARETPLPLLKNVSWLTARYHDAGKYPRAWQEYFLASVQNSGQRVGEKLDHTTIGGQLIEELVPHCLLSEMAQIAIYSHHGLKNCVSLSDQTWLLSKRQEKASALPVKEAEQIFYSEADRDELRRCGDAAKADVKKLLQKIKEEVTKWPTPERYGNRDFFLGMYERILLSLLIDADRRDTEDFMSDRRFPEKFQESKSARMARWDACISNLEKHLANLPPPIGINRFRTEISNACLETAAGEGRLYRLSVPTGSGKTLSSLRFALHHARKFNKERIIYVAPYHSIVEQNAKEIRESLGIPDIVLEHHCNVIQKTENERRLYDRLTEDWSAQVIVTTAVQFFNTLFDGKTASVRRMHSLCNSVILIDEVQSIPVRLIKLFNIAVNFLTEFANTSVVLCTATQPLLEEITKDRLMTPKDMTGRLDYFQSAFRRTKIIDDTGCSPQGMEIEEAAEFLLKKARDHRQVLFITNTKSCAQKLFREVEEAAGSEFELFHLSTGMCPQNRDDMLERMKQCLADKVPLICISTQVIEAGVDISFRAVIRSLAGLDSIIQAAGRCNRNGKEKIGFVYLVRMSEKAENVSRLRDIRLAQDAMQAVLTQFHSSPDSLDGRLDSQKAIELFYQRYFQNRQDEMAGEVTAEGVRTNLVDLLSANKILYGRETPMLKQAFQTAGELFEAIEDIGKVPVVVPYGDEGGGLIRQLENVAVPVPEKKMILRSLQRLTVSITERDRQDLGNAVSEVWDGRILVLAGGYYNDKVGVLKEPQGMKLLYE